MRRRKQNPPNDRFAGTHFEDLFLEWLKGYTKREEAIRDVTRLSNEVLNYRYSLFPVRSVPVKDHPGYVTHNREFFSIQFSNGKFQKHLTDYFSEKNYHDGVSFGNAHDLGEFFELALHALLVNGLVIHAVEWGEVKLGTKYYILPVSFNWVNPAPVHINEDNEQEYVVQKFSFITKFLVSYFEYSNHTFSKSETLIFRHPTLPKSPVTEALKYLKDLNKGMDFSLIQGQSSVEPTNYSFRLEQSRYQSTTRYWRLQNMTRVMVRRIFNQPVSELGVPLTTYYQVYAYAEYKKHLNILRDYFVNQFNEQVMKRIQKENKFARLLVMTYKGFASNKEISSAFLDYSNRKITVDDFLNRIKDNYDIDAV